MTDKTDLPRYSKGRRPHFFKDGSSDHLLSMVLELSAELSVAYGKIDKLQRYLVDSGVVDAGKLEAYRLSPDAEKAQEEWRGLFIERLYSSLRQQVQAEVAADD